MSKLRCIAILSLLIGGPVGCRAGLGGADYRFDVQWVEAGTKCGPGDWGRRMTVGTVDAAVAAMRPEHADAVTGAASTQGSSSTRCTSPPQPAAAASGAPC